MTHLLMQTEAGIPVLAALWYTADRREIPPNEQHIYSFLEVLPFANLSFAICLHWDQSMAMLGAGKERPRWRPRWKKPMLPPSYIGGISAAIAMFLGIPYVEELVRCYRAERRGLVGAGTPVWLKEKAEIEHARSS